MLRAESLTFAYPRGGFNLGPLDLELEKGDRAILIGPNGSGKSTLLKLLACMMTPSYGRIFIGGDDMTGANMETATRRISFVFQDIDGMLFSRSVAEEVAFGPKNLLSVDDVEERTDRTMKRMGIGHLADKHPLLLSRGEKQRVAVASVMALEPELLLMDEPTKGLDYSLKKKLIQATTSNITIVVSSNDLELVPFFGKVILIYNGTIHYTGTTREFLLELPGLPYPKNHSYLNLLSLAAERGWNPVSDPAGALDILAGR